MKRMMSAQSLERAACAVVDSIHIFARWHDDKNNESHILVLRALIDGQYTTHHSRVADVHWGTATREYTELAAIGTFSRAVAEHLRSKFEKTLEGVEDVRY